MKNKYIKMLSIAGLLSFSSQSYALSCAQPEFSSVEKQVESAVQKAAAIVIAKVVSVESTAKNQPKEADSSTLKKLSTSENKVNFTVVKVWKGQLGLSFSVSSSGISSFHKGQSYLLYMTKPDNSGNYRVAACSRSISEQSQKWNEEVKILNAMDIDKVSSQKPRELRL